MEDKKKRRIAYIISSSEIGGTEKMLLLMLEHLDRNEFGPPVVFTLKGKGKLTEELRKRKIKTHVLNLKKNPLLFAKLLNLLRKESPYIIHTFLFYGNIAGRLCGYILNTPCVISSQRSTDIWRRWYHWKIDRLTSVFCRIIISNSFSGRDMLIKKGKISPEKIVVIPNGIDLRPVKCTLERKSFGIAEKDLVVGTVGNLRKPKGHKYLIEAAVEIAKKFPSVVFIIAGEGALRNSLLMQVESEGLKDKFIFTGFRQDAEELIQLFDVFVLPSLWEGFPVSLLEAMKYGIPSVAFDVADIPFILENGKHGFPVSVGDTQKLASKVITLLNSEILRRKIGDSARKRVNEEFTLSRMLEGYYSIYRTL